MIFDLNEMILEDILSTSISSKNLEKRDLYEIQFCNLLKLYGW